MNGIAQELTSFGQSEKALEIRVVFNFNGKIEGIGGLILDIACWPSFVFAPVFSENETSGLGTHCADARQLQRPGPSAQCFLNLPAFLVPESNFYHHQNCLADVGWKVVPSRDHPF